ncbi:MAG: B12-binding domain-containing radical SAM protein [Coprococcus sp.]
MKILLAAINAKYIHANLAVYSLRAYADMYREQIQIKEYTINQYVEDILADIYREKADVIAFSCYIWNIGMVEELVSLLHQLRPELPVWLGGPEVSYDAADCMARNPGVTGIMRGEGEAIFREVAAHYVNGSVELADIRGIIYRENGRLADKGWREVMDINQVPFVYEDMSDFEHKIIYYETSRGCPFSCSYCLSSIDKKVRVRDMRLVERELQFFIDHRVPQVKFVDRTFNCNKQHALAIWEYIKEHDRGVTNFHFEIGADLLDEEELALLSSLRPGLVQLEIGVQSTYGPTIKEVSRTMKLEKLAEAVRRVNAGHNIHQHLDLIAGLPYENYERFRKSFDDVYAMEPEQLQLGFLKVLKGSRMHEKAQAYGIVYRQKAPYEVLKTNWMSYDELRQLKGVEEMVEVYYNSHQFEKSLQYLMHDYHSPFTFFEELAGFYEEGGYGKVQHGRMQRYDLLLQFAEERHHGEPDILKEAMLYDLYARENLKSRPAWAGEHTIYRSFCEDFYRQSEMTEKYLPAYKGYTSRQMKRMTHMEGFSIDIAATAAKGVRTGGPQVILFDYLERDPLTYAARTVCLNLSGKLNGTDGGNTDD